MFVKSSYGILLFKKCTNAFEILLIQRRYTYEFFDFIYGNYKNNDAAFQLLEHMTMNELLLIYNLDFYPMWQHIWVDDNFVKFSSFEMKFNNNFINYDQGKKLKEIVKRTTPRGELTWEIPKGRKNAKEPELLCAVRELYEETGYSKDNYYILPNVNKKITYIVDKTQYNCKYYFALLKSEQRVSQQYFLSNEINSIRWFKLEEIQYINKKPFLFHIIRPGKQLVRKYLKGKFTLNICNKEFVGDKVVEEADTIDLRDVTI